MEHHRSCVLPSNAPAFAEHGSSIPSRVLQERSGNRRHVYADGSGSWKRSPSTPVENLYSQNLGGGYFTGNLTAQLNSERSEEQIEHETKRLLRLLIRCDKYQKYRDRQPQTQKEKEQKWPDHLEEAFFRGLVRWPPMGRRKHMLDGQLRGRNELVADSIQKDTGEPRTRKQVSSHIQVLKNILSDQPQILVYMSTEDLGTRKRHGGAHFGQLRSRHQAASNASKYNYHTQAGANYYSGGYGSLGPSNLLTKSQGNHGSVVQPPFAVADFSILLHHDDEPIHRFTQLASNSRLPDLNVTDITSWHQQYAEFRFHQTDEWKKRQVLVCDASIKIMAEKQRSGVRHDLSVHFYLQSQTDMSQTDPLHCETRFYDNGQLADKFDESKQGFTETRRDVNHVPDRRSCFQIHFGSGFWAWRTGHLSRKLCNARMNEDSRQRAKEEESVRRTLQYMTAVQDIYGLNKETGQPQCFLTILWRFQQTRPTNEPGRMSWRVVNFAPPPPPPSQQLWGKGEELDNSKELRLILNNTSATSPTQAYPALPLELPHQAFAHQPSHLDLDSLSNIALDNINDFSNPNSATTHSLSTDFSHTQSLASLTHSQDTNATHPQHQDFNESNDIDFHGGQINLRFLEPAINFGTYETYTPAQSLAPPLSAIPGLDQHADAGFGDLSGLGVGLTGCYPNKPWHYNDLISRLEGAAEQVNGIPVLDQGNCAQNNGLVGHNVLHGGELSHGLWKLQSGFGEDTGVGAGVADGRKDSAADTGAGSGIMEFLERERGRDGSRYL
ncbi:hypothetical protein BU24DRAFT_490820 [Aaosphaeria arxii CBS 175.79]|uniref:TEA domain-containing protein n=1 Tax=Aaosphaeria arxii CBS 175.79 TaxID=1450172 RepID=A0A6A5XXR3_9PLEO|nr:uncharacterized protein BU24DRAFT_490820 [Aaosphaeria arxii CBS 175.79]KAF2017703.1 hypothetical protein BU24DRAFT_490820 [Aaosphaeria arxii CBS 175.79]